MIYPSLKEETVTALGEKVLKRFWGKVRKTLGCWMWTGSISKGGYGNFCVGAKQYKPHRISFVLAKGTIPLGLCLDHVCRNRSCVNPKHIRIVTRGRNAIENSTSPAAINAKKTHCIRGHELTGENLQAQNGGRQCRACRNLTALQWYHAKRKRERQGHRN